MKYQEQTRKFFVYGQRWLQKKGGASTFLRPLLSLVGICWKITADVKNFLYDAAILRTKKVAPYVVSIGNIVAGGTGKTPFTLLLAQKLLEKGSSFAILSRGYGSILEKKDQQKILSCQDSWKLVGDEPLLLKQRLQEKADVIVGKNRFLSAQIAQRRRKEILLLDDGMQARSLHRDLEITLLNGRDLFGQNACIPAGFLRESPDGLRRSDYVFVNHIRKKEEFQRAKEKIALYSSAPVIGMNAKCGCIKDLEGKKVTLEGPCALFCGIAHPQLFCDLLNEQGISIGKSDFLYDHEAPSLERLSSFAREAKEEGMKAIICTEKDKVKLDPRFVFPLPLYYMEMDLEILEGKEIFHELIEKIVQRLKT